MPVFSTAIRCMNGGSPRFTIDTNLLAYSVDRSNKAAATAWGAQRGAIASITCTAVVRSTLAAAW